MAFSFDRFFASLRFPRSSGGEEKTAIELLVKDLQTEAWDEDSLKGRLRDPSFPYSGMFDPPKEIEEAIARSLMFSGVAVGRPIVRREPLVDEYQEKLSPPFIYAAWDSLESSGQIPEGLSIGENVFVATAPNGKIYPEVYYFKNTQTYLIMFDSDMLTFYQCCATVIARICFNGVGNNSRSWSDALTVPLAEILQKDGDATRFLASLIFNVLVAGAATPTEPMPILDKPQEVVAGKLIGDLYGYMLAHELGHIRIGHFDHERRPGVFETNESDVHKREVEADVFAYAALCNCGGERGNLYPNVSVIFRFMTYLYRCAHFLRFGRDYGHLEPHLRLQIYLGSRSEYPHPDTRLMYLRKELRANATKVEAGFDELDRRVDTFFENLWKPVILNLISASHSMSRKWLHLVEHHEAAYQRYRASRQ